MERRFGQRELVLKTARMKWDGSPGDLDCAILDISDGGARILLPQGSHPPDVFDLVVDPDHQLKLCRVVWKAGNTMGV